MIIDHLIILKKINKYLNSKINQIMHLKYLKNHIY